MPPGFTASRIMQLSQKLDAPVVIHHLTYVNSSVIVVSVCRDKHYNIFVVCLKDKGSHASDRILWESNVLRALQRPIYLHNRETLSIYR